MKKLLLFTICLMCASSIFAEDKYSAIFKIEEIECIKSKQFKNDIKILSVVLCGSNIDMGFGRIGLERKNAKNVFAHAYNFQNVSGIFSMGIAIVPDSMNLNFNTESMKREIFAHRRRSSSFSLVPHVNKMIGRATTHSGIFTKNIFLAAIGYRNALKTIKIKTKNATFQIKYRIKFIKKVKFIKIAKRYELLVKLIRVKCFDTEDVTGPDDFYVAGGSIIGSKKNAFCTSPLKINDDNAGKKGRRMSKRIFRGVLSKEDQITFALIGFDEDASRDSNKILRIINKISSVIDKIPFGEKLNKATKLAIDLSKAVVSVTSFHEDDKLGTFSFNKTVDDIKFPNPTFGQINTGHKYIIWSLRGKKFGKSWNYKVKILIQKKLLGETD